MIYRYKKNEVEAYRLSCANIEEVAAWSKCTIVASMSLPKGQYIENDLFICHLGEWLVKERFSDNYYVFSNMQFEVNFKPLI